MLVHTLVTGRRTAKLLVRTYETDASTGYRTCACEPGLEGRWQSRSSLPIFSKITIDGGASNRRRAANAFDPPNILAAFGVALTLRTARGFATVYESGTGRCSLDLENLSFCDNRRTE
jgi:hypothetical protein